MNKYDIGTGFFSRTGRGAEWFWDLWFTNTIAYSHPEKIFCIAHAGCKIRDSEILELRKQNLDWLTVDGDLGCCASLLDGSKKYPYVGNGPALCAAALLSYCDERDFIYKEQDLLAFGPWVEKMYEEIGDGGMIMGKQNCMPVANSLMMVKHWFIPKFVSWYMSSEAENTPETIAEHKFGRFAESNPEVRFYSFGVDRDRPIPYDAPIFYAQKFTKEELEKLKELGLVNYEAFPDDTAKFTNHD